MPGYVEIIKTLGAGHMAFMTWLPCFGTALSEPANAHRLNPTLQAVDPTGSTG